MCAQTSAAQYESKMTDIDAGFNKTGFERLWLQHWHSADESEHLHEHPGLCLVHDVQQKT